MSEIGTIFDIRQLSVFDGPGIRTTVFLKGCPLRCMWCHNPEGLSYKPQLMRSGNGCLHCGKCRDACSHPDTCVLCGSCVRACPKNLIRICGEEVTAEWLTGHLLKDQDYLEQVGGGITFSGGEPLGQPRFLLECLERLGDVHTCIETSGYAQPELFEKAAGLLDYVIMDLKLMDGEKHRHYTGFDNEPVLRNLEYLKQSGQAFRIRIPVIPGVNDDRENYERTAAALAGARNLDVVELLPYHVTAGAKYSMVGMEYSPEFDEGQEPELDMSVFERAGIPCRRI